MGLGWVSPTIIGGSTRKLNALVINEGRVSVVYELKGKKQEGTKNKI